MARPEVPEERIEAVEGAGLDHDHAGVVAEDATLHRHLEAVHGLGTPGGLSAAAQEGLHDRLHHQEKAADDL